MRAEASTPNALVWVAALLALFCSLSARSHPEVPQPFVAIYAIRLGDLEVGEARRTLRREGNGEFILQSLSRAKGILSYLVPDRIFEESRWEYDKHQRIRLLSYVYRRTGGSRERALAVMFDWANHVARISGGSETREVSIPDGTLDPLLVQMAISQDLTRNRTPGPYTVLDALKHRLRVYPVELGRTADIDTPLGPYMAVELRRLDESDKRQLVIWCAPALGYLPARIDYTEKDGRSYRSVLRSIQWSTAPAGVG